MLHVLNTGFLFVQELHVLIDMLEWWAAQNKPLVYTTHITAVAMIISGLLSSHGIMIEVLL